MAAVQHILSDNQRDFIKCHRVAGLGLTFAFRNDRLADVEDLGAMPPRNVRRRSHDISPNICRARSGAIALQRKAYSRACARRKANLGSPKFAVLRLIFLG